MSITVKQKTKLLALLGTIDGIVFGEHLEYCNLLGFCYMYFLLEGMAYQCLLKNELLGAGIEDLKVNLVSELTSVVCCM